MNLTTIYLLHTNEGERYVRSTDARLRTAMFKYIKEKRAEGYSLASIVFVWSRVIANETI